MRLAAGLGLVAGCMMCPSSEMAIVAGPDDGTVHAGDVIDLRAGYGDWHSGPGECDGRWYVNAVRGGTPEVGTIDDCGHYQAPATLPAGLELIVIEATDGWELPNGCADCCPYAKIELEPLP